MNPTIIKVLLYHFWYLLIAKDLVMFPRTAKLIQPLESHGKYIFYLQLEKIIDNKDRRANRKVKEATRSTVAIHLLPQTCWFLQSRLEANTLVLSPKHVLSKTKKNMQFWCLKASSHRLIAALCKPQDLRPVEPGQPQQGRTIGKQRKSPAHRILQVECCGGRWVEQLPPGGRGKVQLRKLKCACAVQLEWGLPSEGHRKAGGPSCHRRAVA